MKRVRQRDTAPELKLRKLLTDAGIHYRVCPRDLPGRPDIANKSKRWAIFVHGCFWHGHRDCRLAKVPANNHDFWESKLQGNRERDARKAAALEVLGFRVITVWQCQLDEPGLASRIQDAIVASAPSSSAR